LPKRVRLIIAIWIAGVGVWRNFTSLFSCNPSIIFGLGGFSFRQELVAAAPLSTSAELPSPVPFGPACRGTAQTFLACFFLPSRSARHRAGALPQRTPLATTIALRPRTKRFPSILWSPICLPSIWSCGQRGSKRNKRLRVSGTSFALGGLRSLCYGLVPAGRHPGVA